MTLWTEARELLKDVQYGLKIARLRRRQADLRAIAQQQRTVARDQQRVARDIAKLNHITGVQFPIVASCPECGHDFRVNDEVQTHDPVSIVTTRYGTLVGHRTYEPGTDSEWAPSETGS